MGAQLLFFKGLGFVRSVDMGLCGIIVLGEWHGAQGFSVQVSGLSA